ncbi:MAG: hypothetical protein P8L36_09525 [SAR324 cluster bacterium]|nr:hypothetical protein [SAR324 cluster bacterium]
MLPSKIKPVNAAKPILRIAAPGKEKATGKPEVSAITIRSTRIRRKKASMKFFKTVKSGI